MRFGSLKPLDTQEQAHRDTRGNRKAVTGLTLRVISANDRRHNHMIVSGHHVNAKIPAFRTHTSVQKRPCRMCAPPPAGPFCRIARASRRSLKTAAAQAEAIVSWTRRLYHHHMVSCELCDAQIAFRRSETSGKSSNPGRSLRTFNDFGRPCRRPLHRSRARLTALSPAVWHHTRRVVPYGA